jgi:cysteine desulfuration protein SufE
MRTIDEILEYFSLMDDWESRYQYLIDLGKTLPPMPPSLKNEENLIRGCTSKVWLVPEIRNNVLSFQADSDSHIVKGLVAILFALYNNQPVAGLAQIPVHDIFDKLDLSQNLSPNRRNGFFSMVERLQGMVS